MNYKNNIAYLKIAPLQRGPLKVFFSKSPLPRNVMKHKREFFKHILQSKLGHIFVKGVESANIGVIFLLVLVKALSETAQYIVFPVTLGATALSAIFTVIHAHSKGKKNRYAYANAAVNITASLGIIAGIIFTFVGITAFNTIAPFILSGALSLKTMYDLGTSCYFWFKYLKFKKQNPEKSKKYYSKAFESTISFVTSALATIAASGVLIGNINSFSSFAIAGAIIGSIYAPYAGYQSYLAFKKELEKIKDENSEATLTPQMKKNKLSVNAKLHALLGTHKEIQNTPPVITLPFVINEENIIQKYFLENDMIQSSPSYDTKNVVLTYP